VVIFSSLGGDNMLEEVYKILNEKPIDKEALMEAIPVLRELDGFEFYHPAHAHGVLDHSIKAAEKEEDEFLRLVLLFHDVGKIYTAVQVPNHEEGGRVVTKFPGHEKVSARIAGQVFKNEFDELDLNLFTSLIEYHDTPIIELDKSGKLDQLVMMHGVKFVGLLLRIQTADLSTHEFKYAAARKPILDEMGNKYLLRYKK